ncbi:hypothetical protein ABFS82_13G053500 [Erythranthe guttata]
MHDRPAYVCFRFSFILSNYPSTILDLPSPSSITLSSPHSDNISPRISLRRLRRRLSHKLMHNRRQRAARGARSFRRRRKSTPPLLPPTRNRFGIPRGRGVEQVPRSD